MSDTFSPRSREEPNINLRTVIGKPGNVVPVSSGKEMLVNPL